GYIEFFLDDALPQHSVSDLPEARDICASHIVTFAVILSCGGRDINEDAGHNLLETLVSVRKGPRVTRSILLHLQCRSSNTTGVSCLARSKSDSRLLENMHSIWGTRHVCTFGDIANTVILQQLRRVPIQFILGRARKGNVCFHFPNIAALNKFRTGFLSIDVNALATVFFDVPQEVNINAFWGQDIARRIGHCDNSGAVLLSLRSSISSHVAGARDDNFCATQRLTVGTHHFRHEIDGSVASCLSTNQRTAPGQALTGQHARFMLICEASVLTKKETNFPSTHSNIAGRNVAVFTNMTVQLGHK